MSEDSKILKKLDTLAKKIDILTKVTAINIQREKFIEGKKQKEKLLEDAAKAESNLSNEKFLSRAPSHVVDAEKAKLKDFRAQIDLIDKNLDALNYS